MRDVTEVRRMDQKTFVMRELGLDHEDDYEQALKNTQDFLLAARGYLETHEPEATRTIEHLTQAYMAI